MFIQQRRLFQDKDPPSLLKAASNLGCMSSVSGTLAALIVSRPSFSKFCIRNHAFAFLKIRLSLKGHI
ncbi:hypothetical protein LXA19_17995, partial [Erwinia amylovora]|nr:hypothetical protein [Erwinia amylovora]